MQHMAEVHLPLVLPYELLARIIEDLSDRQAQLLQLRASCAALREIVDRELFREICIVCPAKRTEDMLAGIQVPHIATWVCSISFNIDVQARVRRPGAYDSALEACARLYGNLRIFPRLQGLRFNYRDSDFSIRDLTPSQKTLRALSGNFPPDARQDAPWTLSSLEISGEPPDPVTVSELPGALFTNLTRLCIRSSHVPGSYGRLWCSRAGGVLWNRLYPDILISPARYTLTHLDLDFQIRQPAFPYHPDLQCAALKVLRLANVVLGSPGWPTERFILRHARTLERLVLDKCPMLVEAGGMPVGGADAWAQWWDALRQKMGGLRVVAYEGLKAAGPDGEPLNIVRGDRFCYLDRNGEYTQGMLSPSVRNDWVAFCELQWAIEGRR